jgi:type VI secretion system secreted protein VgrG
MPSWKQADRPIRIKTPLGDDVLLVGSLNGTEQLGRPFKYELVLYSEDHELDYKKLIGQNVTLFVDKEGNEPRYFNGFVSRFSQSNYEDDVAEYRAVVVPWLWFLTRSSDCRIFQNKTIPDILKQVFSDHGFTDVIDRLQSQAGYRTWDYCVQYRETAFNFVSRLMEEEGIYYFFKHEADKHSLVLCDSPASHRQFGGYEDLFYRPSSKTVLESLWTWTVEREIQSGGYATTDFDFTTPKRNTLANSYKDRGHGNSQFEQFDYLGEQSPFSEGERYAQLRLDEQQAQHEIFTGEGDARGICAGVRFTLKGHPRREFEQEYLTTGAEYTVHCGPLVTGSEQEKSFEYKARLTALPLEQQFRSQRFTPKPIIHGPQTAIVVGPSGEKIYTDEYGRVKVHFHWDRHGTTDENASCWVRVSQAWAGKPKTDNWGDMALPHVGDEVIVECLEGDPDRPIITGRVYNASNMPPQDLPANKDKRIMQDDFGNKIILDATPGDEHIRLYSPHHKSGINIGRSVETWSQSDAKNIHFANAHTIVGGTNTQVTLGFSAQAVAGAQLSIITPIQMNVVAGASLLWTLGYQWNYSTGSVVNSSNKDILSTSTEDYILGAGDSFCVAANTRAKGGPCKPVISADHEGISISCGNVLTPETAGGPGDWYKPSPGDATFPLLLVALGAALSAGSTAAFIERYDDEDKKDWEKYVEPAGIAAFAVALIGAVWLYRKQMRDAVIEPVEHLPADVKGRIKISPDGDMNILGKTLEIGVGPSAAPRKKAAMEITDKGEITLKAFSTQNIKISGKDITQKGKLSVNGGNLVVNP